MVILPTMHLTLRPVARPQTCLQETLDLLFLKLPFNIQRPKLQPDGMEFSRMFTFPAV